ncbi:MAG: GNAT family N-acetyltransferase [Planctomycetota bacterium]
MRVLEVNEIEQLASYGDEWTRLLAGTPGACFFQTLDWLSIYWRHFGNNQRLRTLLVYDDERLVGILPLAVKAAATRGGAVRTLGYPLDGWGTRYGAIGANSRAVLSAGLRHIQETSRDWDVLELNWTPQDRHDDMVAAFEDVGVRTQISPRDDTSLVDLSLGWGDYWMSRDGKHRSNVRRAEKKLATLGPVDMLHYRSSDCDTPDARWELYETCEQIAGQSWQGTSATGTTLTHERVRPFLRDIHDVATRLGAVAIHLLSVRGEPVAFAYNYVFQGTEFGLRMGYDPQFKNVNAGTVLIHRMLQNAFAGNRLLFDLGEGDSRYKRVWRTHAMPSYRFCHYAKTSLRAQALRWKRQWCNESAKLV